MKSSFVILFRLVKKNRSHHLNLIIEIDSVYLKLIPALLTSTDIEVSNKSISMFFYNSLLSPHTLWPPWSISVDRGPDFCLWITRSFIAVCCEAWIKNEQQVNNAEKELDLSSSPPQGSRASPSWHCSVHNLLHKVMWESSFCALEGSFRTDWPRRHHTDSLFTTAETALPPLLRALMNSQTQRPLGDSFRSKHCGWSPADVNCCSRSVTSCTLTSTPKLLRVSVDE